jgi:lipoate-protein ligase A
MNFPLAQWRLILSPPAAGAWNMALDEAILETTSQRLVWPTLRLYAWDPPCLSLGYAQPYRDVDIHRLKEKNWDIVRRPTGGRAILHTDELTYAVMAPDDEPRLVGSVLESYFRLAQALIKALEYLDITALANQKNDQRETNSASPVCFEVPSNYEITVQGKKLIGSAQARRRYGVLQHGTLPLYGDLTRITEVLAYTSQAERTSAAERLLQHACTVEDVYGLIISWQQAAVAISRAFQETLNLQLQPGHPTPAEINRAAELVEEKYSNPAWTERFLNA